MATSITLEELKWFHSIDRDIFTVLVVNLRRDITESMRVIGLWLWLEEMGYPNIILLMLSSTISIINSMANEAVLCLNCIDNVKSPASNEIPFTKRLMKKPISLSFCRDNRVSAVRRISQFVSEIGNKVFNDIVEKTVKNRSKVMGSRRIESSAMMGGPKSGHPVKGMVPSDKRTIFITFSRGYPIPESEVRNFFNMKYGECVECIYMQQGSPNGQAVFARVVFRSYATVAFILEGMDDDERVKLKINGKHAWARKYVPRVGK